VNYSTELSIALNAADTASAIQLKGREKMLHIEKKNDRSPVTQIDKECEELIRDTILKKFPQDGFLGEETGQHNSGSSRKWIVDPLDGTRPFIRGIPTFSTLIALEDNGIPVVGVIRLPALDITCWATSRGGAFKNNSAIHVSSTDNLSDCMGSALGFVEKADTDSGQALFTLMKSWDYSYGFMDAYSYVCVADGSLDCTVNLLDKAWDCAAAACIVTEAGGTFCDIYGKRSVHEGTIVLCNGKLEQLILSYFRSTTSKL
jgi:histidinol phosphatase-like enzyme (inositol monophosphatase family)